MAKRKAISVKVRFEVFKRDRFTCQYCGKKSPDVVLHVDHIDPVSNGGKNEVANLVTSCQCCNLGKGKRLLSDDKAISMQRDKLAEIEERREQLKMMLDWKMECFNFENELIDAVDTIIRSHFPAKLSHQGRSDVAKLIKKFGIELVLECCKASCESYSDVDTAIKKIGGFCVCRIRDRDNPGMGRMSYVRAILKNKEVYVNDWRLKELFEIAISESIDVEEIVAIAKESTSWADFRGDVLDLCGQVDQGPFYGLNSDGGEE